MTKNILLDAMADFTRKSIKDMMLPTAPQKDSPSYKRPADVYKMRLDNSGAARKKCPYIIHQIITGEDSQLTGQNPRAYATIRSIFSVYCDNEQEGSLMLLELMERLRIDLLRAGVIGDQFVLDLEQKMEMLIYPENIAPYYAGEMKTVWELPTIPREVRPWLV